MNGKKARLKRKAARYAQYGIFQRLGYTTDLEAEEVVEQIKQMDGQTMNRSRSDGSIERVCVPYSFKWVLKRLRKGLTVDQMIEEGQSVS